MKQLRNYINIRKKPSTIKATDDTIHNIVADEIHRLGYDADLNHIDVSEVTSMYNPHAFGKNLLIMSPFNNSVLNNNDDNSTVTHSLKVDVSKWNVSKCTNFSHLFYDCKQFNCDLSEWDMSHAETLQQMFTFCENFNSDLSKWNTMNVRKTTGMFNKCLSFDFNTIANWDVGGVIDVDFMFAYLGTKLSKENIDLSCLWFYSIHDPYCRAFDHTDLDDDKRPYISGRGGKKHTIRLQ